MRCFQTGSLLPSMIWMRAKCFSTLWGAYQDHLIIDSGGGGVAL